MKYRASKALDDPTEASLRELVPTKLAAAIWNCISKYKTTIPNYPQSETCELLILDRSIDQVTLIFVSSDDVIFCLVVYLLF